ncbi:MAG: peptide deformylase [Candidatus Zambryskibacteria bacterium RIFCSPLOWO2_12_FULL_45_14]|uniref:Peptide deformylase n=2 Tax=Candidatus Zambryskiibacteriota TaxID=1817925 RepID=A0A1G2UQA3_9BACT|nr:MAG: peptide deformylase [Candidatus Zambryskibacteria bacterium RIFCSPLOWO2_02_FULL_44_12b]OHB13741.1 MAG: peptide deformylase [Candidatus Zambryskibacteria bacterium RIFCSPLOWO2_12_FULL_45_14]
MTKILQRDAPVLREVSSSVPIKNIKSKRIQDVIDRMKEALHAEEDGVAIAAPQIGESLRIFVVSGKALALAKKVKKMNDKKDLKDLVLINPEIIKFSKKQKKVEEGCLSIRWLYGKVKRSEKVTIRACNETGKVSERGATGLLAQIFQHEVDHLNGILFIDKAEDIQDIPPVKSPRIVFFGGSQFSKYVLDELTLMGLTPLLSITSAREPLSVEKLKEIDADLFVVASFGKILPKEVIDIPKYKTLNVHPSLLPHFRGASPIQGVILTGEEPGVTIIKMDEKMDHGPILAQVRVPIFPWPDHYQRVEETLGRTGGRLLGMLIPKWIEGKVEETPQDDTGATYTKLIRKEDGLLNLNDPAEKNLRKVLAYSTWPGAHILFKNKRGKEVRVVVKDAKIEDSKFSPTRVIPEGKREMNWQDFLRGN